ncbi:Formin-like protein 15 [Hordeum vulgare]|nr:Formin-like protein 15 [Hordeum vulgare]
MPSPRVLFDKMPTAPVDNNYNHFMEDVIYNGGHVPAYDPDETQSQHADYDHGDYDHGDTWHGDDEEADDRADYDHGDTWHGDDDIY